MRRPTRYSGCWGPGTLVVTVLTLLCGSRVPTRPASASSIAGGEPAERGQALGGHRLARTLEVLHLLVQRVQPFERVLDLDR